MSAPEGVARRLGERLREKPLSYWLIGALILLATIVAKPAIDRRLNLDDVKNYLFMHLARSATNPSTPHEVKLVSIGDADYWSPAMGHRSPTNRAFLARLVRAADAADASAIALDFDLSADDPASAVRPGDYRAVDPAYRAETDDLMRAVGEVAERRHVILAKTIDGPEDGPVRPLPELYHAYGLCTALEGDGRWLNPGTREFPLSPAARRNIACGYIEVMTDTRRVPPPARLIGQRARLDSFPLAIARARDPSAPARFAEGEYFASYIPEAALMTPQATIPASALLRNPGAAAARLQGYPVIIGAAWHLNGNGQGPLVDLHDTPIGTVVGALIHVNLAEAVLSNRTYPALPEWAMLLIEVALGIGAAILFALAPTPLIAVGVLAAAMPVLLGIQWLSLQLFGTFLDLLAPILGLGIHAIADRLLNGSEA